MSGETERPAVPRRSAATVPVAPKELLASADHLLTTPLSGLGGLWPRACALLIRLALEQTLDRYWRRTLPAATDTGMRAQLLLLPLYAGAEAAGLAREAWLGLAGAGHHHAYELAPTAAELRGWHTAVRELGVLLEQAGGTGQPESN